MSIGLIGLLDDVVGLAKLAAASIDDVAGQAAKAGAKAAGVVIDDAAVTPRYVVGFAAARELPIIGRIAAGSLRNKLLVLLPAALALSLLAPWAITPLLMIGGAYLCYEGTEKAFEALFPHRAHEHEAHLASLALNPKTLEDEKVASAIKTDFILSAEIMAITLAAIPATSFVSQAGKGLMGTLLRYPYEVRDPKDFFGDIPDVNVTKDMLDLARHIVQTKSGHFQPEKFEDRYESALKELIERKQAGKTIEPAKHAPAPKVVNLLEALKASIDAEKKKPAAASVRDRKPAKKKASR